MKHVVIGTAGHIDHGKTELVKALTGINTDRFKEEQDRGITIDIGFAPLPVGDDLTAGFVDVPGHEKFVKNMLAGIWGIDLVLLVVAADESIKPQTREHFEICRLLKVKKGLIALTKTDLVDDDLRELAALEVRDFVRGSFLEEAPVVPVSARSGEGLDDLRAAIAQTAAAVTPGKGSQLLRLPVDRSFIVKGFGTVVTGTLVSGSLSEGEEVSVFPGETVCRVRGLQVHNQDVEKASAGRRTAVNLQGIDAGLVQRGDVISRPGQIQPSSLLDVRLSLLDSAPSPLKDLTRVRFHQGTSELFARVKLLSGVPLLPGQEAPAQLRLERPGCSLPGDRFVIRRYSPTVTIGGGVVLDVEPLKHRGRVDEETMSRLDRLEPADPGEALLVFLEGMTAGAMVTDLARRAGLTVDETIPFLEQAGDTVLLTGDGAGRIAIRLEETGRLETRVTEVLSVYHRENPLRPGMPREELRARSLKTAGAEVMKLVLGRLEEAGAIESHKEVVRLASHRISLTPEDEKLKGALEEAFRKQGLNPQSQDEVVGAGGRDPSVAEKLLHLLLSEGILIRIKDGRVFHAGAIEGLKARLWELLPSRKTIDIGAFKELTGTTRKNAIPLLEHLDSVRVTRRVGSDREILPPPGG